MSVKPLPAPIEETIDEQLDIVRTILLDSYRQKIVDIEAQATDHQDEIDRMNAEIAKLSRVVDLNRNIHIEDNMSELTSHAVRSDPNGMANALGVVMGLAIHAQVENDRDEIVEIMGEILADVTEYQVKVNKDALSEALYPVIFPAVSGAARDAVRGIQRQIDERLKAGTRRIQDIRDRILGLRHGLQGVSRGDSIFRDALPFQVEEMFFIQNGSGLLIDHHSTTDQSVDSDLISAMLTAIRDFAGDTFSSNDDDTPEAMRDQLDEIRYANRTIIIKSGAEGYCAVVVDGTEPRDLRQKLQQFVFDLHNEYGTAIHSYTGDPATVPILTGDFRTFVNDLDTSSDSDDQKATQQKASRALLIGMLIILLLFALFIFQLWVNYQVVTKLR